MDEKVCVCDLNASVSECLHGVFGLYGLEGISDKGDRLVSFACANSLCLPTPSLPTNVSIKRHGGPQSQETPQPQEVHSDISGDDVINPRYQSLPWRRS